MSFPFYQQPNTYNALCNAPQMPSVAYGAYNPINYTNQQPSTPQSDSDARIWVQGEAGANSYLVAPNSFVRLWDSLSPVFYEKRADASGRPTTEIFEYKKRSEVAPMTSTNTINSAGYDEQLKKLEERISILEQKEVKTDAKSNVKSILDDSEV